ncbi:hypothetical protein HFA01_19670 [Halobacillus faecis]|uniref:Uncharacterized protein n=1 Tax=Halobacillus faecis TaxID=360184 RepID=A0A511WRE7_9BACI|nr:hypothetical protein HFA01_19670 [Halobacillus faecis]
MVERDRDFYMDGRIDSRKSLRFSNTNALKNIPIVYSMKALTLLNDAPGQT